VPPQEVEEGAEGVDGLLKKRATHAPGGASDSEEDGDVDDEAGRGGGKQKAKRGIKKELQSVGCLNMRATLRAHRYMLKGCARTMSGSIEYDAMCMAAAAAAAAADVHFAAHTS
jgi:hypothetical protein